VNSITLFGNLTRDPEVKSVKGKGGKETTVTSFTLATNHFFKKNDGSPGQETTFVPCEAWDSGAETLGKYLKKGSPLLVQGALRSESWEKDGVKHSRLKVRVANFTFVGGKGESADANAEAQPAGVGADNGDGDTPF